MFFIYQILITLIILFSPVIVFFRIVKDKEDKVRFKEKFCFFSKKRGRGKLVWFHGASVGEIMSIIPLIHKYEKNKSIKKILITSNTLSSSKVISKYKFKKTVHQFFPIDQIFFTSKFLNYWKPQLAIFLESEIWPNMIRVLEKKKIPLVLLNARITKKSYNRWIKLKSFSKYIFSKISIAYPQNKETKYFLKKLKVKNIKEIGNLKLIENIQDKQDEMETKLGTQFIKNKVWIAASTHPNEEKFLIRSHIELRKKNKDLITVIIPRHIHRVNEIISEIKSFNLKIAIHSSKTKSLKDIDIYIVDTFGESKKFFKIGNSVFMGGSLVPKGGQNPLEAARYGAKILHGPHIDNFKDVFIMLKAIGISKEINSPKKLASSITFKKNLKGATKIKKIGGLILKKTIKELEFFINNEPKKT